MGRVSAETHQMKKEELMEKAFECLTEEGLHGTGIRKIARYCNVNPPVFYTYFKDLDDLIVQSTDYCMSKVEDDFMKIAPKNANDLERFLDEVPYWTAQKHGKKYRLMYQVYTHPKYREYGKKFFEGVDQRYAEYAQTVSKKIGVPSDLVCSMIFIFVRAAVHYALFEDEFYLRKQISFLKLCLREVLQKKNTDKLNAKENS